MCSTLALSREQAEAIRASRWHPSMRGAMHGLKAIPTEWLEPLELREVITELAEDL